MSMPETLRCRVRQAFLRPGRRQGREPVVEDGPGALYSVPQLVRSERLSKPLLVAGPDAGPWADRLRQALEESDVALSVWSGEAALTVDDAEAASLQWDADRCDCFIAVGGPETIDLAKAAAARAVSGSRSVMDLIAAGRLGRRIPAVIAVPTAAGSGTEALSWMTVCDTEGRRYRLEDPALMPAFAVPDPALIADTPRPALASCVMNGICLASEAYISRYATDRTRSRASEAMWAFLEMAEPCWNSGGTVEQRIRLLEASRLAGLAASQAGAGYARALSEAYAAVTGTSFAEACAVILPAVLVKYGDHAAAELSELAAGAGVKASGTRRQRAEALIDRLCGLAFRIGLPETLEGAEPEALSEAADTAAATANPRWASPVVWTAEDCERVLRAAIQNKI